MAFGHSLTDSLVFADDSATVGAVVVHVLQCVDTERDQTTTEP